MLGILDDIKIIEIGGGLSGAFCGKLLADQGAGLLKIEEPGRGDQARYEPPFLGDDLSEAQSSLFLAFNTNKKGITLDLKSPTGHQLFLRLIQDVDVIIESYTPGFLPSLGLGFDKINEINPRAILISITFYGQSGPWKDYKGSELTTEAVGGFLHAVTGSEDKPPMGTALEQMEGITGGRNGAIATMAALFSQRQTGEGKHVDISTVEATVSVPSGLIHPFTLTGRSPLRGGSDGNVMDGMHLPTKDGEVTLTTAGTGGRPMETWAEFLGEPQLTDPKFSSRRGRMEHWEELHFLVAPKLAEWHNLELMSATMERGLVIGLVLSPEQVVNSPHLEARQFFVEIDHPNSGILKYPGPGFLVDGSNPMKGSRAAPELGQHNSEVYCEGVGLSSQELGQLYASGVI